MADITYYVAMPFHEDDNGCPVAGAAEECQSPAILISTENPPRSGGRQTKARRVAAMHWPESGYEVGRTGTRTGSQMASGRSRSCREARGISARSRTGDPMIGEFGDAKLIKTFGNVPDDVIHNC